MASIKSAASRTSAINPNTLNSQDELRLLYCEELQDLKKRSWVAAENWLLTGLVRERKVPLVAPFLLENERLPEDPLCLPQLSNYQNICASGAYKGFSQEEPRLQHYKEDYEAGMRTLDSNAVTTAVTTGRFWNLALAIQAEVEGFSSPARNALARAPMKI